MNLPLQYFNGPAGLIIAFLLALVPLLVLHELGHFFMAKLMGVWAHEFGIGIPPRIVRLFKWRETEFTLNWIPFGAFVLLEGEQYQEAMAQVEAAPSSPAPDNPAPASKTEAMPTAESLAKIAEIRRHSLETKSPGQRFLIFAGGPLMNILTAWIVAIVMYMTGVPNVQNTQPFITKVVPNSPGMAAGIQSGDIILKVNDIAISSVDEISPIVQKHLDENVNIELNRNGTSLNVTVVPRSNPPAGEGAIGIQLSNIATRVMIQNVTVDSPAARAGIQNRDVILKINGEKIFDSNSAMVLLEAHAGEALTLEIEHEKAPLTVTLTPATDEKIGVELVTTLPPGSLKQFPFPEAFVKGSQYFGLVIGGTLWAPIALIQGQLPLETARPMGVVGISNVASQSLQESITQNSLYPYFSLLIIISIALGVFNFLPIPALDGGRILFIIIEKIRGHRLTPSVEAKIHQVALLILLGIFVVVTIFDISDIIR